MDYVQRRAERKRRHMIGIWVTRVKEWFPEVTTGLVLAAAVFVLIPVVFCLLKWIL